VKEFFEENVGPIAKLHLQQDCGQEVRIGRERHAAKAALEQFLAVTLKKAEEGKDPGPEKLGKLAEMEGKVQELENQFAEEQQAQRKLVIAFVTFRYAAHSKPSIAQVQ
jgi:hypothetical protein